MKNPPPAPKSKAAPKPRAELEKPKAQVKDGFTRVIQPTSGRSVLNALDTLFPESRKKTVLTASQLGASGNIPSASRVFKPQGRGKNMEIKFSDDSLKGSAVMRGPSTLEVINNIRSPSPDFDFDFDDMDDLIRAAPGSALDPDNFPPAVDLTVDDVEVPKTSQKRLRDSPPGPVPAAKRMRRISDWQSDTDQRRSRPVRSDSVREVGAPTDIALECFLT